MLAQVLHGEKSRQFKLKLCDLLTVVELATSLPTVATLEALRDQVLLQLKLGKQSPGYKAALKALNYFIAVLTSQYAQEYQSAICISEGRKTVEITSERIDDIPVIVEWLKQMEIAKCIDQKLKEPHGNHKGLSYG